MRRRPFGLQTRVLVALLVTSALTLVAAAAALLSPLQQRLRDQAASSLVATARSARPGIAAALAQDRLSGEAFKLAARTDARVQVYNRTVTGPPPDHVVGAPIFDTSFGAAPASTDVYHALRVPSLAVTSTTATKARVALAFDEGKSVLVLSKDLTDVAKTVDEVRRAFLAAAGIGLVASLVLGLLLSRTLLRRLERLRRSAVRMEREGMDAPAPRDETRDEVGDLARAMARMQDALRRQEAARRQFVATASHELRTPLTSLSGTLELLGEDLDDPVTVDVRDAREQVGRAQEEVARLRNLATELLDLSRLDAGIELRSEPVELSEIARAVAAEFGHQGEAGGHRLAVVPSTGPVWAKGDPDAVARVARILIDNALRYSPRGSDVRVAAAYHGDQATLEVADDGPGVPEDERDAIFARFQRGSRTAGEGGFGLGLAIGRELAERLGGRLELAPGEPGARFVLTLRIELPAGSAQRPDALVP